MRRPPTNDFNNIFKCIQFKIKTGANWNDSNKYGSLSSSTVYKYFKIWSENGLFNELYKKSLKVYSRSKTIRWKYQQIDSTIVKAYRGGDVVKIGKNSTDRGRNGSKIHASVDENGIPLRSRIMFYVN